MLLAGGLLGAMPPLGALRGAVDEDPMPVPVLDAPVVVVVSL